MTGNYDILVVIERIYSYELKSNYLEKDKYFGQLFLKFWNQHKIFNVLEKKKWASEVKYFVSYWLQKCWFQCITKLVVNECQKLLKSAERYFGSILFLSEPSWVRKDSFESDRRFSDCLLTCWQPTTIILPVIERI